MEGSTCLLVVAALEEFLSGVVGDFQALLAAERSRENDRKKQAAKKKGLPRPGRFEFFTKHGPEWEHSFFANRENSNTKKNGKTR